MKTISGISNWKLSFRRSEGGVEILRAVTCDRQASLPEELYGVPVVVLGNHALSDYPLRDPAEETELTNGRAGKEPVWDNQRLQELRLPPTLESTGDFSFLRCRRLRTLHLYDRLLSWGSCSLRGCPDLGTVFLTSGGEEEKEGIILDSLLSGLTQELDVSIDRGGSRLRVIFPGYEEYYDEGFISQAVHFYYRIQGPGYPYHHCMLQKKLDLKNYDSLWPAFLSMAHEELTAIRLAWWRLRTPLNLTGEAEQAYLSYLRDHTDGTLRWLLAQQDQEGLQWFLRQTHPSPESLRAACQQARESHLTAALAILLEEQHGRFSPGGKARADLWGRPERPGERAQEEP